VNQVGYLPAKAGKIAFVAAANPSPFQVIDEATGLSVFNGQLAKIGDFAKPRTIASSYSNSLTREYQFKSDSNAQETLFKADFNSFQTPGLYRVAVGGDTSASFAIDPGVYSATLEKVLFFFGANRCGANDSWLHGACHLKDGSGLGETYAGSLAGGWHDCGDHGKYSATLSFTAMILSMTYAIWPDRAPDRYGSSYASATPDGIPDLLREAKIGADYIYHLYLVSKDLGLIEKADMFHSVGRGPGMDHINWGLPEMQDTLPMSKGGPHRPVSPGIGSNVAASYAASLALFSAAWKKHDSAYASEMVKAAITIYDSIVMKRLGSTTTMPCCYTGGGPTKDDEALAALALWYATGDARFRYDLLENTAIAKNAYAVFNSGEFPAGHMGKSPFSLGGWPIDMENVYSWVFYGLAKLILPDAITAKSYGVESAVRDSLLEDVRAALKREVANGSNGTNTTGYPGIKVDEPYHGVFTSVDWGFNRYNLGSVNAIFMYHDLTGDSIYGNIGIDNLNYVLGANPYDISFITGCGDRNLQHPHNRAANPDGFNQDGAPYPRRVLTGAVMGGVKPGKDLRDEWLDYTNSETCIDFAAQAILPLLILSGESGPVGLTQRNGRVGNPSSRATSLSARVTYLKGRRDVLGRKAVGGNAGKTAVPHR
jgi:Glycosyl hydrolase family 9/Cellulase N-terminal ig-like domain